MSGHWKPLAFRWEGTLAPGRDVVTRSAAKAGSRWRRVADANPCAWCAMLVTRGPVYSRGTVVSTGAGRRYHKCCGCTCEEFRGDPNDWQPTGKEWEYIKLYNDSTEPGMTDKEAAAAMRRNGYGVVNDANPPQTQTGGAGSGKPPARVRGMLGPETPDEFSMFNGWQPDVRRSEIETFDINDATALLFGDESGHGFHSGDLVGVPGKSTFPPGFTPQDTVDWVNAIVDDPKGIRRVREDGSFVLFGSYRTIEGVVYVRYLGRWAVATAHPKTMEEWLRATSD